MSMEILPLGLDLNQLASGTNILKKLLDITFMNRINENLMYTMNCKQEYSEEYDTYYCKTCNKWLEDPCDDPTCEYCTKRPPVPLQVP